MTTYRTGNHEQKPDWYTRRRPDDQLVAVVVNGDQALAERICELLNERRMTGPSAVAVDYPHACPGCGKHYRMPKDAASCDRDHVAHAERIHAARGGQ